MKKETIKEQIIGILEDKAELYASAPRIADQILSLLKEEKKKLERWAIENKQEAENGTVVGLAQLLKKLKE